MFNFQKLITFCALFAVVWVQSSIGVGDKDFDEEGSSSRELRRKFHKLRIDSDSETSDEEGMSAIGLTKIQPLPIAEAPRHHDRKGKSVMRMEAPVQPLLVDSDDEDEDEDTPWELKMRLLSISINSEALDEQTIEKLLADLNKFLDLAKKRNMLTKQGVNHFISWDSNWKAILRPFKIFTARTFEEAVKYNELTMDSENTEKLAELALWSLDYFIKDCFKFFETNLKNKKEYLDVLKREIKEGRSLECAVFVMNIFIDTNYGEAAEILRDESPESASFFAQFDLRYGCGSSSRSSSGSSSGSSPRISPGPSTSK